MRQIIRTAFILCALAAFAAQGVAQLQIPSAPVECSLEVTEGQEAAPVDLEWGTAGPVSRGVTADGLTVTVEERFEREALVALDVTVRNAGDDRRLLAFAARADMRLDPESVAYWDGAYSAVRPIDGSQATDEPRPRGAWPLSATGDASGATFIGLTPDTLISYAQPTLDYAPGGKSEYRFHVRTVVDPGGQQQFGLVIGRADTRWGLMRSVWQQYHRAFPAHFTVSDEVPDVIWGTSAQYHAWWQGIDREELRRLHCTWDWCYAPFKRSGDFWGREDEWEYQPLAKPFSERKRGMLGGSYDMGEISDEQFRSEREAFFEEYGYDTGSLFYTPSGIWVESQLAEGTFADSLVVNDETKTELSAWVTGYDDER
ncbi:MAG: hypothetical protein GF393_01560, partial [Armatimonadia bacterium]|nr:hypothetical protein [Armatimonadia bacterium]